MEAGLKGSLPLFSWLGSRERWLSPHWVWNLAYRTLQWRVLVIAWIVNLNAVLISFPRQLPKERSVVTDLDLQRVLGSYTIGGRRGAFEQISFSPVCVFLSVSLCKPPLFLQGNSIRLPLEEGWQGLIFQLFCLGFGPRCLPGIIYIWRCAQCFTCLQNCQGIM